MSDKLAIAKATNEQLKESLARATSLAQERGVDISDWGDIQARIRSTPLMDMFKIANSLNHDSATHAYRLIARAWAAEAELDLLIARSQRDPSSRIELPSLRERVVEVRETVQTEWHQASILRVLLKAAQDELTRLREQLTDRQEEIEVKQLVRTLRC